MPTRKHDDPALEPGELDRDITRMDLEEIEPYWRRIIEVRDSVADAIASIDMQLGEARSRRYTEGTYADPVWFRRTQAAQIHKQKALRQINRRLQDIEGRMGQLRK